MLLIDKLSDDLLYENLELAIDDGEIIGLIGENGVGKSTLINFIYGLYTEYTGTIEIDGEVLTKANREKVRSKVKVAFQNPYNHFVGYTVFDEIVYQVEQSNLALNIQDLSQEYLDTRLIDLSGGQAQKLNLYNLLELKPKLLIIDESCSNLSKEDKKIFFDKLKSDKQAVLLITNNHSDLTFCDKVYELKNKKAKVINLNVEEVCNKENNDEIIYDNKNVVLKAGFNVVVGDSASGKSHLLEGLFGLNNDYEKIENSRLISQYPFRQIYFINFEDLCKLHNVDITKEMKLLNLSEDLLKLDAISLSTGQLAMLFLLVYIKLEPELLLLDEFLEVISLENREIVFELLKGRNVLFVSHNLALFNNKEINIISMEDIHEKN